MLRQNSDNRLRWVAICCLLLAAAIIIRLFVLQVLEHDYYSTFAASAHEIYKQLYPRRGAIYFQDSRDKSEYPAAINRRYYQIYAIPREIKPENLENVFKQVNEWLAPFTTVDAALLRQKLAKSDDPYEPLAKKMPEELAEKINSAKLPGIYTIAQEYRYYPEEELGGNILGFSRPDENGRQSGNYGIEGYWNKTLTGRGGFLLGEKGALGNIISIAGQTLVKAENGADIVLTIDRNLQYEACRALKRGWEDYKAKSAALVMLDTQTGAVLAMCSFPDFDPNNYSQAGNVSAYNNTAVFTPYEPGSVFKPLTMAAALDLNLVSPQTTFVDPCERRIDKFTIHNAQNKCYGTQTMTGVLENSINTGMIWVEEKIGRERFIDYVDRLGFGQKTGLETSNEMPGDVSSLEKKSAIYGAVASFGQGITVTPIQLATAYAAIANQGQMPKPYIISEVRYADGKKEIAKPTTSEIVISPRAAKLLTGMLVAVIESGHGKQARLAHYFLAGKTGTAQIPGPGGYTEETNHTFTGFGPAEQPKVALVVKYEAPQRQWAESTAGPVFKEVMDFTLKYYGLPEER